MKNCSLIVHTFFLTSILSQWKYSVLEKIRVTFQKVLDTKKVSYIRNRGRHAQFIYANKRNISDNKSGNSLSLAYVKIHTEMVKNVIQYFNLTYSVLFRFFTSAKFIFNFLPRLIQSSFLSSLPINTKDRWIDFYNTKKFNLKRKIVRSWNSIKNPEI